MGQRPRKWAPNGPPTVLDGPMELFWTAKNCFTRYTLPIAPETISITPLRTVSLRAKYSFVGLYCFIHIDLTL